MPASVQSQPLVLCALGFVCLILLSALVIKQHTAHGLPWLTSDEQPANSSCMPLAADSPQVERLPLNGTVGIEFIDSQSDFAPSVFCSHLFHFVEYLVAASVLLQQDGISNSQVRWLRVYHGTTPRVLGLNAWECTNSRHNLVLLHRLWPNAEPSVGNHRPPATRVIAIDRWLCDYGTELQMLLKYTPHFNAHNWHAALSRGAHSEVRRQRAVRVTYIDRQGTKRQLATESHTALLRLLGAMPGVELKQARMETIPFDEQLAIMRSTDVLIGVHGNGLTQQMFMSPRRYVV